MAQLSRGKAHLDGAPEHHRIGFGNGMAILDFAGASQATVSFVTNYGHRLYSDDFVRQLDRVFGSAPAGANDAEFFENQAYSPSKRGSSPK